MKKMLLILVALLLSLGCFFACGEEDGTGDGGDYVKEDYGTAAVFIPGDTVHIVTNGVDSRRLGDEIVQTLDPMLKSGGRGGAVIASIYHEKIDCEIVIGIVDEERPATVKAYAMLDRMEKESYFDMRYVVYAYDNCIAIAYDDNEYTNLSVLDVVGEEMLGKIFTNNAYVALSEGSIISGKVDLTDEQELIDAELLSEAWSALEKQVGRETTQAFRKLYSMYTDDLVGWVANLYDPGTGGFYASSGGRDGAEFGPDVQCTVQLLRFISGSGMVNNLSSAAINYIPEFMQQQMIYFAKSLQDPSNGHFYHPQWGKALTDSHISRRGRDLGWATDLLATFNSAPTYRAPNGTAADGITADEYWQNLVDSGEALGPKPYASTESPTLKSLQQKLEGGTALTSYVGLSAENAISNVILTSNPEDAEVDSSTAYLSTHKNFINYMLVAAGPGMDSNPYSMGNTLNATYSQIKDASNKLGDYTYTEGDENSSTNAALAVSQFKVNKDSDTSNDITLKEIYQSFDGMNLKEITIFVLNEKINPAIGLWGEIKASKPNGTEFYYTNGFFKVITLYNSWGFQYPAEYIDDAANALMDGLMGDEPSTGNICEVYNVWSAISTLRENLKYHTDAEMRSEIEAQIKAILAEKSAAAVENTYNKIKGYKKYDGGFAHSYTSGTSAHQGLPVGHGELNQSDVDATCIGSTGLTRAVFQALGLSSYKIPLYTESDWMRMLEIFISQDPVIKYSYDGEVVYTYCHDFESGLPESAYYKYNTGIAENTFSQVKLDGMNVGLLNKGQSGKQSYLDFKISDTVAGANIAVFESKILVTDIKSASEPIELRLYDGTNADKRIYTLYIYVNAKTNGSPIYIAPKSDTTKRVEIGKIGEWFTLRLTYQQGEIGSTTSPSVFKTYVNGSETPVIVDEKFETGTAINAKNVGFSRFLTMSAFSGKIYVDDIRFAHEIVQYKYDAPTHNSSNPSTPDTPAPPSEYTGLPTTSGGSTTTTTDGKLTFDGVTAFPIKADNSIVFSDNRQSTWLGSITTATEDGNSFMRIIDNYDSSEKVAGGDAGQCILLFDRPDYTGSDGTFVFEGRFRITPNTEGKHKDGLYMFDVTFRNAGGTRVYRTYFGNNSVTINGSKGATAKSLWTANEWFTLRIEYTVSGSSADSASWDVKVFVNNELAISSDAPTAEGAYADSKSIDKVGLLVSREFIGHLDFDDIKIYQKAAN